MKLKAKEIPVFENHESFFKYIRVESDNDCWVWTGIRDARGYGLFYVEKSQYKSHRVSFSIFKSDEPLDLYLVIDHICRNKSCVNPSHLRQVTRKINALENNISLMAANIRKTHCKWGHEFTDSNTYKTTDGRHCNTCRYNNNLRAVAKKRAKLEY